MKIRFSPWVITAFIFLAVPLFVMRPDRDQGAGELSVSLWLLRYQVGVELFCCAGALATLILDWAAAKKTSFAAVATVLLLAGLTQFNVFEFLFHPAGEPEFESVTEARWNADEKVMAVMIGRDFRAYPVRSVAYHHVVNDVLGDVPIAVTY